MPSGWSRPHHQTDANSSQFAGNGNLLGRQRIALLCESGGSVQLEDGS
jgi:hypothetical protein